MSNVIDLIAYKKRKEEEKTARITQDENRAIDFKDKYRWVGGQDPIIDWSEVVEYNFPNHYHQNAIDEDVGC